MKQCTVSLPRGCCQSRSTCTLFSNRVFFLVKWCTLFEIMYSLSILCVLFSSGGCNRVLSVSNCVFFEKKNTQLGTESTRLHPPLEKRVHVLVVPESKCPKKIKQIRWFLLWFGELPLYKLSVAIYYLIRAKRLYRTAKYVILEKKIGNIHDYRVLAMCLLILLSCQSTLNGLRYAPAGLRR